MSQDRDWMMMAACREHDPELWFPTAGQNPAFALSVCRSCPVLEQCAQYSAMFPEAQGVWAGQRRSAALSYAHYQSPMANSAGLRPCGTLAAYRRHGRHGEKPCRACLEVFYEYQRDRQARGKAVH